MKIHTNIQAFSNVHRPVVTIGTFDGVHLGHQTILQKLKELAQKEGGESVLFTFHPHPRMVLYPEDHGLELLNTQAEKQELLDKAGIDHLVVVPFNKAFSRMTAEEYIRTVLHEGLHAHAVVIGYDHRFGKEREGDIETLRSEGERLGFVVYEIPAHAVKKVKVSSTKVRSALQAGEVGKAAQLLGYRYQLSGKVVHGNGNGKRLGFPTANLIIDDPHKLVPANGVYAVEVELDGRGILGMMNIGVRPTLHPNGSPRTVEVHLFDVDEDLYGKSLQVRFVQRVRDEKRFTGEEELRAQLGSDRKVAIGILEDRL